MSSTLFDNSDEKKTWQKAKKTTDYNTKDKVLFYLLNSVEGFQIKI